MFFNPCTYYSKCLLRWLEIIFYLFQHLEKIILNHHYIRSFVNSLIFFVFFPEIFGQFSFLGFWFWCSSSSFCQSSFDGAQPFKDTWFSYLGVNLSWYQFLENLFIFQSTNYLFVVNCFFLIVSFFFFSLSLSLSLSNCLVQSTISYFKSCLCFIASSVFFSWIFLLQSQN